MPQVRLLIVFFLSIFVAARFSEAGGLKSLPLPSYQDPNKPADVNPGVRITSPAAGQKFAPGDTMIVNVQVDKSLNATDVVLGISGMEFTGTTRLDLEMYQAKVVIPESFSGPSTIGAVALDADHHELPGAPVTIAVSPTVSAGRVTLAQRYYYLEPSVVSEQLSLTGTYADNIQRDITSSETGTTYATSNPAVIRVTPDGLARIKGDGIAVVTAANGSSRDYAIFVVENAASPLAPQDLTRQFNIQQTNNRLEKSNIYALRDVVVTNSSRVPVPGPLYLILTGLPSGVTLDNRSGLTRKVSPGSAFISLQLSGDGLRTGPGERNTLTLQFLNPNNIAISYSLAIVRSSTEP
jgi:hypothetical protein